MTHEGRATRNVPAPERAGASRRGTWREVARTFASVLLVMWAVLCTAAFALIDAAFALNSIWLETETVGRVVIAGIVLASPGLLLAVIGGRRWHYVVLALPLAFAIVASFVPWSDKKRFVADLAEIEPGMTLDEAEAVMESWGYDHSEHYRVRPSTWPVGSARANWTGVLTYRWTPASTADAGSIRFENGRAVRVHWSPD